MFFAFSRFSSTFRHYTMQKSNVLYIKRGKWGHIWRGLKQCRGLGGPRKAVGHSRFHIGAGGCGRRFSMFFAFPRFSSTFQHYTMQKANVLYIKTGQWGHIWRGLKQYCGLLGAPEGRGTSPFSHSRWGRWEALFPCFSHFRGFPARSGTTPCRNQMFYTSKEVSGGIFGEV